MSYAAALGRLHALGEELYTVPGTPRRKFELAHMRMLMAALGDPQRNFASILVAGTNGKGSTAATLASILTQAGCRTGLYTSPHLSQVNERVQINGCTITDGDFAALFVRVEETAAALAREGKLPGTPSFFETVTAIGFLHFAACPVHTAVLEVGMGGRLDATNIVEPLISVITDISLDHMEWLGSTIGEIAREKAGILRRNGVMVTLPQHPEANRVLGEVALPLDLRAVNAAGYMPLQHHPQSFDPQQHGRNRYSLSVLGETIQIDSPLAGAHQQRNLALAVAAAVDLSIYHSYNISAADIQRGIRNTVWPARLESIAGGPGRAAVLLDAGHNPAGAWALRAALSRLDQGQPMTLVFGCMVDKQVAEMAQILFPLFRRIVVTPVDSPRSASVESLLAAAAPTGSVAEAARDSLEALDRAFCLTPPDGLVVIFGSVYLAGKLREQLVTTSPATASSIRSGQGASGQGESGQGEAGQGEAGQGT